MDDSDTEMEADKHPVVQIIATMTKKFRQKIKELKVNRSGRMVVDFEPFFPTIKKQDFILSINDINARTMTNEEIHTAMEQTKIGEFLEVKFVKSLFFDANKHGIGGSKKKIPKSDIMYGYCDICNPVHFKVISRKFNFVNHKCKIEPSANCPYCGHEYQRRAGLARKDKMKTHFCNVMKDNVTADLENAKTYTMIDEDSQTAKILADMLPFDRYRICMETPKTVSSVVSQTALANSQT